jgi:hypothetical protein
MRIVVTLADQNTVTVDVAPTDTKGDVIRKVKTQLTAVGKEIPGLADGEKLELIVDGVKREGSRHMHKMTIDDPVNKWFDGKPDQLYMITDFDGVDFRKVINRKRK